MCRPYEMMKQALTDLAVSEGLTRRPPEKLRTPPPEPKFDSHLTPAQKLAQVDQDGRHEMFLRELAGRSRSLLGSPGMNDFELIWQDSVGQSYYSSNGAGSPPTSAALRDLVAQGLAKFHSIRHEDYSTLKITTDGWLAIGERPPVWWQ